MSGREGDVLVLIAVVLLFAVAPIIVGAPLAERRGRSVWFGIILTFLFGWFGVLAVLFATRTPAKPRASVGPRRRPCPECGAEIAATAGTCASCGAASTPWTLHGGHWWSRDERGEWRYLDDTRGVWVSPTDGSTTGAGPEPAVRSSAVSGTAFVGLDHVQVAAPAGREFDARRFYGGLLGLEEVEKPPLLAARGGCWFAVGAQQLHIGVADDVAPATKAHPALRVRGSREREEIAERLAEAGYEVAWADGDEIPGLRRFHVDDPFGNRVELLAPA